MRIVTKRISSIRLVESEFNAIAVHPLVYILSGTLPGANCRRGIKIKSTAANITRSKKYNRERLHDLGDYIKRNNRQNDIK